MKLNDAKEIYIGAAPASSVYLEGQRIWPVKTPDLVLPGGYTVVTAIQPAPETKVIPVYAVIDTGVIVTEKIRIEFDCLFYDIGTRPWGITFAGYSYGTSYRLGLKNAYGASIEEPYTEVLYDKNRDDKLLLRDEHYMAENIRYTVTIDNMLITISGNGESWSFNIATASQTWSSLSSTFCIGSTSSGGGSPLRIYGCKVYENGVLIKQFVPVKHVSGIAGLFELIELKLYRNETPHGVDYMAIE